MALRRFIHRLASVFRHNRAEDELERETAAPPAPAGRRLHFFLRRGMTMDDARLAARRAFGGVVQTVAVWWQFLGISSPPQSHEGQIS
jgi:hypothetical protein